MIHPAHQLRSFLLVSALVLALPGATAGTYDDSFRRGRLALRSRDYAAAVTAFVDATGQRPDEADAWFQLGLAYSALNRADEALQAYRQTLKLDPDHVKALNNIGNVRFRRGEYDLALTWYERALALQPEYLLANFHYGWVLHHFNRNEEAETAFTTCLRIEPRNDRERSLQLDALFYLAKLRFRSGDYGGCAERMERVLSVNRTHVEAHYYLGMSYRRLGRNDEAREQLEIHRRLLKAARRKEPVRKADR